MKTTILATLIMSALVCQPCSAQRGKSKAKRPVAQKQAPTPTPEEIERAEKVLNMRELTQKIVFVDSQVVDKAEMLATLRISPDAGRVTRAGEFFPEAKAAGGILHVDQLQDRCLYSLDKGGVRTLYMSESLGKEWSVAQPLAGLAGNEAFAEADGPFMMPDGETLYFSATGKESIGGSDIFVTRYDRSTGTFLKPENVGMPFNSTANEYFFAIDEFTNIGWLVTDRRQPEGKVCVYTFVPSDTRTTYDVSALSEEQLEAYSDIRSIAATWGDGTERKAALDRLSRLTASQHTNAEGKEKPFYLGKDRVCRSEADFKNPQAAAKYRQYCRLTDQRAAIESALAKARRYWSKASQKDKDQLRPEMTAREKDLLKLNGQIEELSKQIRKTE